MPKFSLNLRGLNLDPRVEHELTSMFTQLQDYYDAKIKQLEESSKSSTTRLRNIESSPLFAGALAIPLINPTGNEIANVSQETTLTPSDIPDLPASKIISGTFADARIPNLNASKINAGVFDVLRIPNIDAAKVNSGRFVKARQHVDTMYSDLSKVLGAPAIDGHIVVVLDGGTTVKLLTTA